MSADGWRWTGVFGEPWSKPKSSGGHLAPDKMMMMIKVILTDHGSIGSRGTRTSARSRPNVM